MATIRLRGRTYRAEVCRYGTRRSSTFIDFDSARAWADKQEAEILLAAAPHKVGPPPPTPNEATHPGLEADNLLLGEREILRLARFSPSCGVYFLIAANQIVYVGQSTDIHARVSQHRRQWKSFDSYTYIPCQASQLLDLERHYITAFRPRMNISGVPNG